MPNTHLTRRCLRENVLSYTKRINHKNLWLDSLFEKSTLFRELLIWYNRRFEQWLYYVVTQFKMVAIKRKKMVRLYSQTRYGLWFVYRKTNSVLFWWDKPQQKEVPLSGIWIGIPHFISLNMRMILKAITKQSLLLKIWYTV